MKLDTIVKLRDAFALAMDALQEELEAESQQGMKGKEDIMPNLSLVVWKGTVGPRGIFEVAEEDKTNPHFAELLTSLHQHGDKMTVDGFFVWLMQDGKAIGRKRKA